MVAIKSIPGNDGRYISLLINSVNHNLPPPSPDTYISIKESNSISTEAFEQAIKNKPHDIKRVTFNQITSSIRPKECCHTPGWTLNLIAKLYKNGVDEILEIKESNLSASKLYWYRERRELGISFHDSCEEHAILSKKLNTPITVKTYAERCFMFHTVVFDDLFTPGKGIDLLNNFTNKPIPQVWINNFNDRCRVNRQIIKEIDKYKYL